ncbi:hypothetical protein L3556_13840 [Candidatus Synechococcus calcipolaris G9]|uniref:Uncharacterized protein n=1 Tax=Candidatus Synechococcus calcipolaris G9 TaxID=1497997 RepID=A0ABT6F2C0_9SYNE|nr:hypothetical protein [Candidatus Synechococcus calcipolaris]MDG2992004.1 hypothetical protein [Candidatus Synechococcus calcipolaris G9]
MSTSEELKKKLEASQEAWSNRDARRFRNHCLILLGSWLEDYLKRYPEPPTDLQSYLGDKNFAKIEQFISGQGVAEIMVKSFAQEDFEESLENFLQDKIKEINKNRVSWEDVIRNKYDLIVESLELKISPKEILQFVNSKLDHPITQRKLMTVIRQIKQEKAGSTRRRRTRKKSATESKPVGSESVNVEPQPSATTATESENKDNYSDNYRENNPRAQNKINLADI